MAAERVLGAVRELRDDDRRRRRRHDRERDPEPPANSDEGLRHGSIVGFRHAGRGFAPSRRPAAAGSRRPAVEVETPHPRAAVKGLAERLDGRRLERVEAVGKNLLLRFEGGLVLRSHLRMTAAGASSRGVRCGAGSRGSCCGATSTRRCSGTAPCSSSSAVAARRVSGPTSSASRPTSRRCSRACAPSREREVGDALLDQRLVAGIGNIWKAEALWEARVSPWRRLDEVDDSELRAVLEAAHTLMRASVDGRGRRGTSTARRPPWPPAAASSARRRRARTRAPRTGVPAAR